MLRDKDNTSTSTSGRRLDKPATDFSSPVCQQPPACKPLPVSCPKGAQGSKPAEVALPDSLHDNCGAPAPLGKLPAQSPSQPPLQSAQEPDGPQKYFSHPSCTPSRLNNLDCSQGSPP